MVAIHLSFFERAASLRDVYVGLGSDVTVFLTWNSLWQATGMISF